MEQLILSLAGKLEPMYLFILIGGYIIWHIAKVFNTNFHDHATKMSDSLSKISEDCTEIRKDLTTIVLRVDDHSRRIERIEDRID